MGVWGLLQKFAVAFFEWLPFIMLFLAAGLFNLVKGYRREFDSVAEQALAMHKYARFTINEAKTVHDDTKTVHDDTKTLHDAIEKKVNEYHDLNAELARYGDRYKEALDESEVIFKEALDESEVKFKELLEKSRAAFFKAMDKYKEELLEIAKIPHKPEDDNKHE